MRSSFAQSGANLPTYVHDKQMIQGKKRIAFTLYEKLIRPKWLKVTKILQNSERFLATLVWQFARLQENGRMGLIFGPKFQ